MNVNRILCLAGTLLMPHARAQQGGPPQGPAPTPKAAAPVDLTGYWVSVITED